MAMAGIVFAGGGLVVRDKMILAGSDEAVQEIRDFIENREFRQADEIGVITSYSIHYTKLYDAVYYFSCRYPEI